MKDKRIFLSISGGGSGAIGNILKKGGASKFFAGAYVPYSSNLLDHHIGGTPEKYCSEATAQRLAVVAWQYAHVGVKFDDQGVDIVGIGVSASLAKPNQRVNRVNEAFVVIQFNNKVYTHHILFDNKQTREWQEDRLSEMLESKVMRIVEESPIYFDQRYELPIESMNIYYDRKTPVVPVAKLERGEHFVLYPGSFNPFHNGHLAIAKAAHKRTGCKVAFELSVTNFQKPIIPPLELVGRVEELQKQQTEDYFGAIVVDENSTISGKIKYLTPEYVVLGQDVAIKLFDSLPVGDVEYFKDICLVHDTKLLVFHRKGFEKEYEHSKHCLLNKNCGNSLQDQIVDIPLDEYEDDGISSTLLRNTNNV